MPLSVRRVVARYLESVEEIPVRNKDLDRIVWILPETMKEEPGTYQRVNKRDLLPIHKRDKPRQPEKPQKPHRPRWHRDTIPAPVKPPVPPKPIKPPRPVKPLKPLKRPPRPEPPEARRWKLEEPDVRDKDA